MMQLIHCKTCKGTTIGLGNVSVDVTLSKSDYCEHCRECKTEKQNYFFCSTNCYLQYLKEVVCGKAEFSWKE